MNSCFSGEDGRSKAEQLLHILRQVDIYVFSPVEHQRRRGCVAVYEMLLKFRMLCSGGYCGLGCHSNCPHDNQIDRSMQRNISNLPRNKFFDFKFHLQVHLFRYWCDIPWFYFQLHLYCRAGILWAWEKGSLLIFHAVLILILTLGRLQFRSVHLHI